MKTKKARPVITGTERQVNPKWTVWTGSIGGVDCFSIEPAGDFFVRNFRLDCELPGEKSGWHGSVATLKRKAEKILDCWMKKANLKVNV